MKPAHALWLLGLVPLVWVGCALAVDAAEDPPRPQKLASVSPALPLARYAADLATDEAQYCRMAGGSPFGGRFCDFGPCGPCQPAQWPCGVRTIICLPDGRACEWGGRTAAR